jgi:mannose-1-phosphate guanylyltransferase
VHADHHITDTAGFVRTVQAAGLAAAEAQKITLIGLKPTHPATGFGYIKIGDQTDELMGLPVHEVERFEEKPAYDVAKKYVSEGQYFWNLGLFVAPVATFLTVMKHSAPDLAEAYRTLKKLKGDELKEAYLKLESQAIDIALIEKTDQILVLPGEFDWADVGSYLDLHKILKSKDDNSVEGEVYQVGCSDSMIHGSTRPIIAVGLEGVVVIDTPDGLLVCAKEQSQKVGDLVKQLQQQAKS